MIEDLKKAITERVLKTFREDTQRIAEGKYRLRAYSEKFCEGDDELRRRVWEEREPKTALCVFRLSEIETNKLARAAHWAKQVGQRCAEELYGSGREPQVAFEPAGDALNATVSTATQ